MAQGAHDFKLNEVFVLSCPKQCTAVDDSGYVSPAMVEACPKAAFYVDEYGQPASWIEIENTS